MNHAAVARASQHADFRQRFEHKNIVPSRRKRVRDRAPYDSAADNDNVCLVDSYAPRRSIRSRVFRRVDTRQRLGPLWMHDGLHRSARLV